MVEEGNTIGAVDPIGTTDPSPSDSTPMPSRAARRQPSAKDIQDAVNTVNARLSSVSRVLELKVDAGSGLTVATVKDSRTGEVLQQFPGGAARTRCSTSSPSRFGRKSAAPLSADSTPWTAGKERGLCRLLCYPTKRRAFLNRRVQPPCSPTRRGCQEFCT